MPVITNKPTENALTITEDNSTYQFNIDCEGKVNWISTVKTVATISDDGLLTMLSAGYTEVIVTNENGLTDSVVLTIIDGRETETLTITGLPQSLRVGDTAVQLGASSSKGGSVAVTFSSNNPNVVTISETGYLTIIGKGIATITVKNRNCPSIDCSVWLSLE